MPLESIGIVRAGTCGGSAAHLVLERLLVNSANPFIHGGFVIQDVLGVMYIIARNSLFLAPHLELETYLSLISGGHSDVFSGLCIAFDVPSAIAP